MAPAAADTRIEPTAEVGCESSHPRRSLRIAMIGQKGVPATYGGIEHHVAQLSAGLVARGHKVTVFCRPYYCEHLDGHPEVARSEAEGYSYRGVDLVMLNSLRTKHLDAITHALRSTLAASRDGFDLVHYHGIGPSLVSFVPGWFGKAVVATVHALDYRQQKWGPLARVSLRTGLHCALRFAHKVICVSPAIQTALDHPDRAVCIPNGVREVRRWGSAELEWLWSRGLEPQRYLLFVGRLIEDKGVHLLVQAMQALGSGLKLAVAGDSSFTDDYVRRLKALAGPETVFLGGVYEERLSALFANCALFVLPSYVEGLPLVLLEAMAHGAPVLASDIPENREVVSAHLQERPLGQTFKCGDPVSLQRSIEFALSNRERLAQHALDGREYVRANYNWSDIVRQTEQVYFDALSGPTKADDLA